jgi:S1-C subfamily serine protease
MKPPATPPNKTSGGGIEPVVRAVLAADAEKRAAVRRGAEVGGSTEVPVARRIALLDSRRCEHPRRLAVADPQRDDALVVRPSRLEVAVGHVEDDETAPGVDRRRRPYAAATVVEDRAAVVDARLESPQRVARRQVGGDEVPAVAVLAVRRDPEQHPVPDHNRRGEDAGLVVRRIGGRLGQPRVVVVPVLGAVGRPHRVQRVAAAEDHEIRS